MTTTNTAGRRPTVCLEPGAGAQARMAQGGHVTFKVTSAQTGGAFAMFELAIEADQAQPACIQHEADVCLYVLAGTFMIDGDDPCVAAGPGAVVYVPRGNIHAIRNVGPGPARLLMTVTPGGLQERLYEAATATDAAAYAAVAARHGVELVSG